MEVQLLAAGDEDLAAAACRSFGLRGDLDPAAFLTRPEAVALVAQQDGRLAGWVYDHELAHPDGERTMLLYALDVDEAFRRQGHGRRLVQAFVEHARLRGCTEVWVLTDDDNPSAIATYRSSGGHRDAVAQVMFTWRLADGNYS